MSYNKRACPPLWDGEAKLLSIESCVSKGHLAYTIYFALDPVYDNSISVDGPRRNHSNNREH